MTIFSRLFKASSLLSLCLVLAFPLQASAKKTDEELRARAMDQGRTLQSRIRALKKLYSHMLVDGEIPTRSVCVWDVMGTQGPIYNTTVDQQLRMRHYGINVDVRAYTNEQDVVDKLINGECDTSVMSGAKARQFNPYTASVESLGGVPSKKHLKVLLQVLASPQAAAKMVHGEYVILGIVPIGENYIFTREGEGKTPTLKRVFKGAGAVVSEDVSQPPLYKAFSTAVKEGDTYAKAAGLFNRGEADLLISPLVGHAMFGLSAGNKHGQIIENPVSQMTLQIVSKTNLVPPEVAQLFREDLFLKLNLLYREVDKISKEIPAEKKVKFPERELDHFNRTLAEVRARLTQQGVYNKSMMKLQRKIRCKLDPSLSECKR